MPAIIEIIKQPQILIGICIIIIGIIGIISWLVSVVSPPRQGEVTKMDKGTLTKIENLEKLLTTHIEFFPRIEKYWGELTEKLALLSEQSQENKNLLQKLAEQESRIPEIMKHQEERLSTLQNMFENLDAQLVKLNQFLAEFQKK